MDSECAKSFANKIAVALKNKPSQPGGVAGGGRNAGNSMTKALVFQTFRATLGDKTPGDSKRLGAREGVLSNPFVVQRDHLYLNLQQGSNTRTKMRQGGSRRSWGDTGRPNFGQDVSGVCRRRAPQLSRDGTGQRDGIAHTLAYYWERKLRSGTRRTRGGRLKHRGGTGAQGPKTNRGRGKFLQWDSPGRLKRPTLSWSTPLEEFDCRGGGDERGCEGSGSSAAFV